MTARFLPVAFAATFLAMGFTAPAHAGDVPTFEISIKDHKFNPETIEVPANTEIKLVVTNLDETAEEFESYELNREKIIAGGGGKGVFYLDALKPGSYPFFGDFNQATAKGTLIAK